MLTSKLKKFNPTWLSLSLSFSPVINTNLWHALFKLSKYILPRNVRESIEEERRKEKNKGSEKLSSKKRRKERKTSINVDKNA